ncbi:DUF6519 domain-containing protein [Streptomyces sp. M19]
MGRGGGHPAARLAARAERPEHADDDPCLAGPDARYRGPENQLYRVEVHEGGTAQDATFKWSRENGSVLLPVDELDGTWAELGSLGGDDKLGLNVGDWVEFTDAAYAARANRCRCCGWRNWTCRGAGCGCRPSRIRGSAAARTAPCLRRWDQRTGSRPQGGRGGAVDAGAVRVEEGAGCDWRTAWRCISRPGDIPPRGLLAGPRPYRDRRRGVADGPGAPSPAAGARRDRDPLRAAGLGAQRGRPRTCGCLSRRWPVPSRPPVRRRWRRRRWPPARKRRRRPGRTRARRRPVGRAAGSRSQTTAEAEAEADRRA